MQISKIIEYTEAHICCGADMVDKEVTKAFSSDLMSDVLTLEDENFLLITGLSNIQLIRTAEMANIRVILIARNKTATPEMIELANEHKMILLETPFSIFKASGILYSNGLKPMY